jgi:hypothetical protein
MRDNRYLNSIWYSKAPSRGRAAQFAFAMARHGAALRAFTRQGIVRVARTDHHLHFASRLK